MRFLLLLLLCGLLVLAGHAAPPDTMLYVSLAGENRIGLYRIHADQGTLTPAGSVETGGAPGALAVDPARKFLFASVRSTQSLASFRIAPKTGQLTPLGSVRVGVDAAYIGVDRSGKYLVSAYYGAGQVMVHAIRADGTLEGEPRSRIETARTAHCAGLTPDNRFLFVPHTTPEAIFAFRLDAQTGRLAPLNPDRVTTPAGTGPRHLRFHPSLAVAYVANEQGSSVTAYALGKERGTLTALHTLPTLPAGFQGANSCAELHVHPSGRYLWVSNRGHDSLAGFAVNRETGRLTAAGHTATPKTPRSFALDPSGRFAYAAGQGSTQLAAYRIQMETGALTPIHTYEVGPQPSWVEIVALPQE
ncbi:MAG: lactonase family protein [Armatimonadetes bacterium]|nr:lactonase family protein [Armatimonadota bacterium]